MYFSIPMNMVYWEIKKYIYKQWLQCINSDYNDTSEELWCWKIWDCCSRYNYNVIYLMHCHIYYKEQM